jgi:hypothetical protein
MYASVHIENKVAIEEVLGILKDNLSINETTVTVTTEPPVGYVPPRPLTWVSSDSLSDVEVSPSASRRYITDNEGNVFMLAVTSTVTPLGEPLSTVTAKSIVPYTDEEYDICNTTTHVSKLPNSLLAGDHGYSDERSGGRHLNETAVGRALSETVHDVIALAKDKEVELEPEHAYVLPPDYLIKSIFNPLSIHLVGSSHDLVNQYGAVIGHKVIINRNMCRKTILDFIVALAGLDARSDMGTPSGYARFDAVEPLTSLSELGLNFVKGTYSYVTTPNNEVYLIVAQEDAKLFATSTPTSTVCAIRIAPPVYWGEKIEPTVPYGNVPISEDMRHSYYGRNIARAVDSLLTPVS